MPDPPPDPAYSFDLDGGRVCLDFANTSSSSGDHLQAYADLLAFASQSALLTSELTHRLQAEARKAPSAAGDVLERARLLRAALRSIFTAVAAQRPPASADLDALNRELALSLSHARIVVGQPPDAYAWGWAADRLDLATPLWPIARSAADVLTSDQDRRLVRQCGAGDCAWLFVDTTRNRSRQWCSMQSCGNREKARRHYQRLKALRTTDAPAESADDGLPAPGRARRSAAAPADVANATAG